jgi:hypothetical protein
MQLTSIETKMLKDAAAAATEACAVCSACCNIRHTAWSSSCPRLLLAFESMRDKLSEIRDTDTLRT